MNKILAADAWLQAQLLLSMSGDSWPEALDPLDVVALARMPPSESGAMVAALRTHSARPNKWCVRDSNFAGHYVSKSPAPDGPACFIVWRRGNDIHFIEHANGRRSPMIARRMHDASDIRQYYEKLDGSPPELLIAWIVHSGVRQKPKRAQHIRLASA